MKKDTGKKALVLITGIGYGHSIREAAILSILKSKGYDIVVAGYSNSYEYFQYKYETLEILGPQFPERKFKFSTTGAFFKNLTLPIKLIINYFKLKKVVRIFSPDIIISDFEPLAFYLGKSLPHVFLFNFDPEIYEEYVKYKKTKFKLQFKYINSIYKKALKKHYPVIIPSITGKKENKFNYVNPIVRDLPDKANVLRKHSNPILVSLGGSYFGSEILERLLQIFPKFKEDFIIFSYKTIGKSRDNIHFMPFKENFLEYVKASKGIICFGGHNTISEAVVLKKPSLVFPVPNYIEQALNGYEVEKNNYGMSKMLKYPLDDQEITATLSEFITRLPQLQETLDKSHIKSNGAEQVFKIIEETSKQ
tara:strand:+ start:2480 stop:3571 length:1092 start_codon:yes stop_codon:yes gene_type:complete